MDTIGLSWLEQVIAFNSASAQAPFAGVEYPPRQRAAL